MNKFMIPPDSLGSLLGCVFWLLTLAAGFTAFIGLVLSLAT